MILKRKLIMYIQQHNSVFKINGNLGRFIVVILILVAASIGVWAVMTAENTIFNQPINPNDIAITCHVSGNNIVVQLLESDNSDEVYSLRLIMNDHIISDDVAVQIVPGDAVYPKRAVFTNVVNGIYKDVQISISATLKSGKSGIVYTDNLRVS